VAEAQSTRIKLHLEVKDSGHGVAPEQQTLLFQTFMQADNSSVRQFGGTGLGLVLSRQIARAMGGDVGLAASDSGGSTFWFSAWLALPGEAQGAVEDAREAWRQTEDRVRRLHAGRSVLLAEDNAVNREVACGLLTGVGLSVDTAVDGAVAVRMAVAKTYDLILMDVQMPELDGLGATREIRSRIGTSVPIIALTSNAASCAPPLRAARRLCAAVRRCAAWSHSPVPRCAG
jgi:CheY-like chemotaxis protein